MPVACLQGRLHMYEGLDPSDLSSNPACCSVAWAPRSSCLTNAAGGVNPDFGAGSLMVINDHINLTGRTPLMGANDDALGPRFPDMSAVWDTSLAARIHAAARAEQVELCEGVYVGLTGPAYETPAEVRMLRTHRCRRGGHVHGHGGRGRQLGRPVGVRRFAHHECWRRAFLVPLTHAEVLAAADEAGPRLARVIGRFAADLPQA